MKIDPYYQRRRCNPMTLDSDNIRFMRIFAGVPWKGGVIQQWGNRKRVFSGFRTLRIRHLRQESRAVARKSRDAAAVLFGLKFADNIHYKFKRPASKARLHSSKHTGTKQTLRQNGDSRSFKVTCFGVSGKAIRE